MEELTIGDKIYISSKRASEITGYAKDYIGQLCREGRVSATLVGRSWYVLESAIRDHRFGTEEQKSVSTVAQKVAPTARYTPEPNPNVLVEMQSAWQDWFKQREEVAPEIDEAEVAAEVVVEPTPEPVIEEVEEPEPEEDVVELHREIEIEPGPVLELREEEAEEDEPVVIIRERSVRSSYVPKAIMLVLAGLAVLVAVIGTGSVDFVARHGGIQASAINFLGGVQQYEKANK